MTNDRRQRNERVEYTVTQTTQSEDRLIPQIPLEAMPIARAIIEYGKRQTITAMQRSLSELRKTNMQLHKLYDDASNEDGDVIAFVEAGLRRICADTDSSVGALQKSIDSIKASLPENLQQ